MASRQLTLCVGREDIAWTAKTANSESDMLQCLHIANAVFPNHGETTLMPYLSYKCMQIHNKNCRLASQYHNAIFPHIPCLYAGALARSFPNANAENR